MPIYPYRCDKCDSRWDSFHKIDEREDEECRVCKSPAIREIGHQARPVIMEEYVDNLGAVVTGPAHMRRLMKERNLEEVGQRDIEQSARNWM
jgi:putative FmdB family regulatory protein